MVDFYFLNWKVKLILGILLFLVCSAVLSGLVLFGTVEIESSFRGNCAIKGVEGNRSLKGLLFDKCGWTSKCWCDDDDLDVDYFSSIWHWNVLTVNLSVPMSEIWLLNAVLQDQKCLKPFESIQHEVRRRFCQINFLIAVKRQHEALKRIISW